MGKLKQKGEEKNHCGRAIVCVCVRGAEYPVANDFSMGPPSSISQCFLSLRLSHKNPQKKNKYNDVKTKATQKKNESFEKINNFLLTVNQNKLFHPSSLLALCIAYKIYHRKRRKKLPTYQPNKKIKLKFIYIHTHTATKKELVEYRIDPRRVIMENIMVMYEM
jgi:hypothetical protein